MIKQEWRCSECRTLLGILEGSRLHIRVARRYTYFVSLPVTCSCYRCGNINELSMDYTKEKCSNVI